MPFRLKPRTTIALVLGSTFAYAALRYHAFKGVPWSQLPFYTLNKAAAWSALVLLALAAYTSRRDRKPLHLSHLFQPALGLAAFHALASLALLAAGSYPKLIVDGHLGLAAGLSLALAVAASLAVNACLSGASLPGAAGLTAAASLHSALLGHESWLKPSTWPGGLPPITLLSALCGALALGWMLKPTPKEKAPSPSKR